MLREYGSYRKRLSGASSLLASLLAVTTIAGCDTPISPQESPAASTQPSQTASPYENAAQDSATASADLRQAIDKLIQDANKVAAERDGKVYVETKEFERAIVFTPIPHPPPNPGTITALFVLKPVIVPKNAVVKEWTDHFALAQKLSYRYSYVETLEIERNLSPPYFTAKITILLKTNHRWAYIGKSGGIPTAPDGYFAWWAGSFPSGMYGITRWSGHLPALETPPGKVVTPPLPIDTIGQSAFNSLRQSSPKKNEYAVAAEMAYDHHRKQWELRRATARSFPAPKRLAWSHGLEGDNDHCVLPPNKIRRKEPSSKPATEEQ